MEPRPLIRLPPLTYDQRRHARTMYRLYVEVGYAKGDAERLAERDARWGLFRAAMSEGDSCQPSLWTGGE